MQADNREENDKNRGESKELKKKGTRGNKQKLEIKGRGRRTNRHHAQSRRKKLVRQIPNTRSLRTPLAGRGKQRKM